MPFSPIQGLFSEIYRPGQEEGYTYRYDHMKRFDLGISDIYLHTQHLYISCIVIGSWRGGGNQYIGLCKILYCKLTKNGKVPGSTPNPTRSEKVDSLLAGTQRFFRAEFLQTTGMDGFAPPPKLPAVISPCTMWCTPSLKTKYSIQLIDSCASVPNNDHPYHIWKRATESPISLYL